MTTIIPISKQSRKPKPILASGKHYPFRDIPKQPENYQSLSPKEHTDTITLEFLLNLEKLRKVVNFIDTSKLKSPKLENIEKIKVLLSQYKLTKGNDGIGLVKPMFHDIGLVEKIVVSKNFKLYEAFTKTAKTCSDIIDSAIEEHISSFRDVEAEVTRTYKKLIQASDTEKAAYQRYKDAEALYYLREKTGPDLETQAFEAWKEHSETKKFTRIASKNYETALRKFNMQYDILIRNEELKSAYVKAIESREYQTALKELQRYNQKARPFLHKVLFGLGNFITKIINFEFFLSEQRTHATNNRDTNIFEPERLIVGNPYIESKLNLNDDQPPPYDEVTNLNDNEVPPPSYGDSQRNTLNRQPQPATMFEKEILKFQEKTNTNIYNPELSYKELLKFIEEEKNPNLAHIARLKLLKYVFDAFENFGNLKSQELELSSRIEFFINTYGLQINPNNPKGPKQLVIPDEIDTQLITRILNSDNFWKCFRFVRASKMLQKEYFFKTEYETGQKACKTYDEYIEALNKAANKAVLEGKDDNTISVKLAEVTKLRKESYEKTFNDTREYKLASKGTSAALKELKELNNKYWPNKIVNAFNPFQTFVTRFNFYPPNEELCKNDKPPTYDEAVHPKRNPLT